MRIGYPCINRSIGCSANHTFRLASYSPQRLETTLAANLDCLHRILEFNAAHGILFFRLSSDIVPFASHPVCRAPWQRRFAAEFASLGKLARRHAMRLSMHPDQFTLINSPDETIFKRSVAELVYHAEVLDLMGMDRTAKLQIHVGGTYGDKPASLGRFAQRYATLPEPVRRRLVIENDDRQYNLADCLTLHELTGVPLLYDDFHHAVLPSPGRLHDLLDRVAGTWSRRDGIPMADYSLQQPGQRPGAHADTLESGAFRRFLKRTAPFDMDVMLEIKDKETSALRALAVAATDARLISNRKES